MYVVCWYYSLQCCWNFKRCQWSPQQQHAMLHLQLISMVVDTLVHLCPQLCSHLVHRSMFLCRAVDIAADQRRLCCSDVSMQLVVTVDNVNFLLADEACCVLIEILESLNSLWCFGTWLVFVCPRVLVAFDLPMSCFVLTCLWTVSIAKWWPAGS